MAKRLTIAFLLVNLLYFAYVRPKLWFSLNILVPILMMWEYGGIQRGIMNKIGLSYMQEVDERIGDWRFLTNQLITKLSSRRLSCFLLVAYHLVVLLMPRVKMLITMTSIFVFIIAYKLYLMDEFIREFEQIAIDFMNDPDDTNQKYEQNLLKKKSRRKIFQNPVSDEQQGLNDVKASRDNKNFVPDRLSSLDNLADIMRDPDFSTHCLTITCFYILLEVYGHVLISLTTSCGYLVYSKDRKILNYAMNFSQWSDGGGLLFGSWLGKTPFANSISPKKTIQGVIGAIVLPMVIATAFWFVQHYAAPGLDWFTNMPLVDYWFLAAASAILAVLGDLCESFLKRSAGIKDSSSTLGVHGGVFDRFDSILLNGPFYMWYVTEYLEFQKSPAYSPQAIHFLHYLKLRMN